MKNEAKPPLVILRRSQVEARTGLSCSTIYRRISEGTFPAPVDLGGGRSVGWLEHEINDFITACVAASREQRA
jgi:prophage regulatory protein